MALGDSSGLQALTNHRSEPHLATDAAGRVMLLAISSPFGITETFQPKNKSFGNSILSPHLPSQSCEAETGHHYNHMRDCSPELGRYLQAEPSGLDGGMNFHMPMLEVIQ